MGGQTEFVKIKNNIINPLKHPLPAESLTIRQAGSLDCCAMDNAKDTFATQTARA